MNRSPKKFILVIFGLIVMLSIAKSFYYSEKYGGTDLRCRIVGSRLLLTDNSPYFYKWHKGDDLRYLDPNDNMQRKVNGNVVTPALLLLNSPLSFLSYNWIRILWTIIQYCLAGLSIYLIWKVNDSGKDLLLPLAIILFGFLMSDIWFYNIERGQTYILYCFIFSSCYFVYHTKWKYGQLLAGLICGIFIWIRPLFLFFNIPFLLVKDFRWLTGSVIGFVLGFLVFFVPFQRSWNDYRSAIQQYELEYEGRDSGISTNELGFRPQQVEGVSNLSLYKTGGNFGGLHTIQKYMKFGGLVLKPGIIAISFVIVLIFLSFLFLKRSKIVIPKETDLFLFAFLLYMLSELFIIGSRGGYNMIEWLFAGFIMLIAGNRNVMVMITLGLAFAFMNSWPFFFPHQNEIGELIAFYVLLDFIFIKKISANVLS